jgi:hypothetical protein
MPEPGHCADVCRYVLAPTMLGTADDVRMREWPAAPSSLLALGARDAAAQAARAFPERDLEQAEACVRVDRA